MRAILAIGMFLTLASPHLGFAESPRPRYTTLMIEYTGERIRFTPPVVITTSQEEGEWYIEHVLFGGSGSLPMVRVVPQSVLNEITELPLLKRALENAKPVGNELNTKQNAKFTAGVEHDHGEIMLDKQPSIKILKGIERIVAKYPSLRSALQKLEFQLH